MYLFIERFLFISGYCNVQMWFFLSSSNEINCDNDKQEMDIKINYLNSKKQQHKRPKKTRKKTPPLVLKLILE